MNLRKFALVTMFAFAMSQYCGASRADEAKGQTLNISGKRVKFDEIGLQYMAIGSARAFIEGEKAAVEADEIRYNDLTGIMPPIDSIARPLTTKLSITEVHVDHPKSELEPIRTGTDYIDGK
jgi:hypothetical protein